MKPVSAKTERRLREALARLVTGGAIVTGSLPSIAKLAREAGVSRATANRAVAVLAERREASMLAKNASPSSAERYESVDHSRRVGKNILAQHIQVRALLRGEEHRRATSASNVVSIVHR